jgi:mycothiol synthase
MEEPDLEVLSAAGPDLVDEVTGLVDRVRRARGDEGLSEARLRALAGAAGGDHGKFLAVVARAVVDSRLVGYAQVDHEGDRAASSAEMMVEVPDGTGEILADRLLDAALSAYAGDGGGRLRLWVSHPDHEDDTRAAARGFTIERDLLQLRCALPLPPDDGEPTAVRTRSFRVGEDEAAWLVTNNRAFAGHPEQGTWDLDIIRERETEPWFDADGFLVLEIDGRMVGSCWTKVHTETSPPLGEIYVISVDPDFHGRGLGRALTRAGLDHLASIGIGTGVLYVDAANVAAVSLYRSMGFTTHHVDRSYVVDITVAATR